jgi:hypothetical protein
MSNYEIKPYSYAKAKELGVTIKPSSQKNKKIDVYKNGKFLYAIGDIHFNDYPTFLQEKGKEHAETRRHLYHMRHKKDNVIGTRGWFALNILW